MFKIVTYIYVKELFVSINVLCRHLYFQLNSTQLPQPPTPQTINNLFTSHLPNNPSFSPCVIIMKFTTVFVAIAATSGFATGTAIVRRGAAFESCIKRNFNDAI